MSDHPEISQIQFKIILNVWSHGFSKQFNRRRQSKPIIKNELY